LGAPPPTGIASLLGLGLKFCIESPRPNQSIDQLLLRFQHSERLHFHFSQEEEERRNEAGNTFIATADLDLAVTYIPSLYMPSTWSLPVCFSNVELAFGAFDKHISRLRQELPMFKRHNLLPVQRNVISELRSRKDLIIYLTDKNLGPSVADCPKYIRDVLKSHLLNDANYEYLPPDKAKEELKTQ
jgi:hypothetical protein